MAQYTEAIEKLYVAYFNRGADPAGLSYWENVAAAQNGDVSSISEMFSISAEYLAAYSGMSSANIINQIYLNLFGRESEAAGRDFWASHFDAGRLTMANIVTTIANGAQGSDKTAFAAKVSAATMFTNGLNTPEKAASYAGENALVLARGFLSNVTDAATLENAAQVLNGSITMMQNQIDLHGKRLLYLARGQDNLQGTGSEEHFFAYANPGTTSLNEGDALDAGAGNDSLSVIAMSKAAYTLPNNLSIKNLENLNLLTDKGLTADLTSWDGLTMANIRATGTSNISAGNASLIFNDKLGSGSINVNSTGDITINANNIGDGGAINVGSLTPAKGNVTINTIHTTDAVVGNDPLALYRGGPIHVTGGKEVTISQRNEADYSSSWYQANVIVDGTLDTNKVVSKTQRVDASSIYTFTINDVHAGSSTEQGTIKSVSVDGPYKVIINDNALTDLSIHNTYSSSVIVNNAGLSKPNTTLNISMGSDTLDLTDAGVYTKLNFTLTGDGTYFSQLNSSVNGSAQYYQCKWPRNACIERKYPEFAFSHYYRKSGLAFL